MLGVIGGNGRNDLRHIKILREIILIGCLK